MVKEVLEDWEIRGKQYQGRKIGITNYNYKPVSVVNDNTDETIMKLVKILAIYIAVLLTIDAAWNFYQDFPSVTGFVDHTCRAATDDGATPKTKWSAEL